MGCDITGCASLIWDRKSAEYNKTKEELKKKKERKEESLSTTVHFYLVKDWPKWCEVSLMYSVQNVWTGNQNK